MKILKEKKPLFIRILAVAFLVLLCCCNLPSPLYWPLCLKQDLIRPPHTEVLVSACKKPRAVGVPGGEALFVREELIDKMYLLDLRTGEKRSVPNDPLFLDKGIFLSSELVWLEGSIEGPGDTNYRPHYILDLTNGQRYEVFDLTRLPRLEGGKFDPKYYTYFESAEQVFIHQSKNTLIALSSDFRTNRNGRVAFSWYSNVLQNGKFLEQLMKDLGVSYEIIDLSTTRYADLPSTTGRYVVRNDGIYLSGTNTPVIDYEYANRFLGGYFKGWYYDESGVVVQDNPTFLIHTILGGHFYLIHSPILKLRLPVP